MARENNIDLALVKGTGAGGRITKQDVEDHLAASRPRRPPPRPHLPCTRTCRCDCAGQVAVPAAEALPCRESSPPRRASSR